MVGNRIEVFAEDIGDNRFAGFTFEPSFGKEDIEKIWIKASQTGENQSARYDVVIEAHEVPVSVSGEASNKGYCIIDIEGFSDDGSEGEMEY